MRVHDTIESRNKQAEDALSILESHPDFASVEMRMIDRLEECEKNAAGEAGELGTKARLEVVLERYDIRAQAFLALVSKIAMQNAYMTMLHSFEQAAWKELTGWPVEIARPASAQTRTDLDTIGARTKRWTYAGYQRLAEAAAAATNGGKQEGPRTKLAAADWKEIEINFLSDQRVEIRVGERRENCNCGELGFLDRRSGKPNLAWIELRRLAEAEGGLKTSAKDQSWSAVEKRMQVIRKFLKSYFQLESDPLPFVKGAGFRARFAIRTGPSYET